MSIEFKKQVTELKQSISLTGDNSKNGLEKRRENALEIKNSLNELLKNSDGTMDSSLISQLIQEVDDISKYENWCKVLLPYISGIIKKDDLRSADYPNASKYGAEGDKEILQDNDLFETRYYVGLHPEANFVTEDLVIIRADTPPNFNEFWHLHTDTDEIVTCYGQYQVLYQISEQIKTANFVQNDILFVNKGTRHSMQSTDSIVNTNFCVKTPDKIRDASKTMMSFTTANSEPSAFPIPLAMTNNGIYSSESLDLNLPYVINSIELKSGQNLSISNNNNSLVWIVKGQGQIISNGNEIQKFKNTPDGKFSDGDVIILDKSFPIEIVANSKLTMFMVIKNALTM